MKIKPLSQGAALMVVAGLALAGCTAPAGGSDESKPTTLHIAQQSAPSNFSIGYWSGGESYTFMSVYDTLLGRTVDGTIVPDIAESWKYDDTNTIATFAIRDGMKFTDGTPVDADAVVASLEASRTGSSSSAQLASIESVEAPDDSTVVVTLSHPDASFIPVMTSTVGAIGAPGVLTAESSQLEPVGSGAYTLDKANTTVGSVYTLQRNDDNWNADAYPFETVEIQVIADPTAVQNAMQAGQLDWAPVPPDVVSQFSGDQFTLGTNDIPAAFGGLWLVDRAGSIVPALADVRVREAINLAIDRKSITENLNAGGSLPTNQVLNPLGAAYDEKLLDEQPFNLDKAKKLMAEAGYADGFAVTMPSTVVSTTYESVLTQQLAAIGITVTWESVAFSDFYSKVFAGNYGMFFMYNGYSGSDAQDIQAALSGLFNPYNTTTPELDELLQTANAASEEDQPKAYSAISQYFIDQAWFAPMLYSAGGQYVVADGYSFTPPFVSSNSLLPWQLASN